LKLILPLLTLKKNIATIDLLDPLIKDYLLYSPNCTYKSGLIGHNVNCIGSTIEEFFVYRKYDVVVMINVLDHCFNIDLIFEKIYEMMNEGALLVFSEKVRKNDEDIKNSLTDIYDAGHPIRISENYLNDKLKSYKILYLKQFLCKRETMIKYLILQK